MAPVVHRKIIRAKPPPSRTLTRCIREERTRTSGRLCIVEYLNTSGRALFRVYIADASLTEVRKVIRSYDAGHVQDVCPGYRAHAIGVKDLTSIRKFAAMIGKRRRR